LLNKSFKNIPFIEFILILKVKTKIHFLIGFRFHFDFEIFLKTSIMKTFMNFDKNKNYLIIEFKEYKQGRSIFFYFLEKELELFHYETAISLLYIATYSNVNNKIYLDFISEIQKLNPKSP